MLIWILSHKDEPDYSNKQIIQSAKERGHSIEFIHPKDIDIILTSESEKSITHMENITSLPQLVIRAA